MKNKKPDSPELQQLRARAQDQLRATLIAEGRDPDRMTEGEMEDYITDYVDRIIHEHRAEERAKQQAD